MLLPHDRERIEKCAERLGVYMPGEITLEAWPIVLLEAIVDRIEQLEKNK
jgi:hypothetical protein